MTKMTAAEAWEGFVGSQTPAEFMEISRQKMGASTTVEEAVKAYADDIPLMFNQDYTVSQVEAIAALLAAYINEKLGA